MQTPADFTIAGGNLEIYMKTSVDFAITERNLEIYMQTATESAIRFSESGIFHEM